MIHVTVNCESKSNKMDTIATITKLCEKQGLSRIGDILTATNSAADCGRTYIIRMRIPCLSALVAFGAEYCTIHNQRCIAYYGVQLRMATMQGFVGPHCYNTFMDNLFYRYRVHTLCGMSNNLQAVEDARRVLLRGSVAQCLTVASMMEDVIISYIGLPYDAR